MTQLSVKIAAELIKIPTELDNGTLGFNGLSRKDSIHEALCKCIHEQDEDALEWLTTNISNIQVIP